MIAALIPAYNEEQNIKRVLDTCHSCAYLSEIIVIDDGSKDQTAEVALNAGVRVIREEHAGKGMALIRGAQATTASIIVMLDADLVGLTADHIQELIAPISEKRCAMTIGLRDKGWYTSVAPHISPVLGGERVLSRDLFLRIIEAHPTAWKDFGVETAMNAYCESHGLLVEYINMPGVTHVIKEKKYGFWRGLGARCLMIGDILRAEIQTLGKKK
jgi:polyisoprenyl-phosphate glycosyltransferase